MEPSHSFNPLSSVFPHPASSDLNPSSIETVQEVADAALKEVSQSWSSWASQKIGKAWSFPLHYANSLKEATASKVKTVHEKLFYTNEQLEVLAKKSKNDLTELEKLDKNYVELFNLLDRFLNQAFSNSNKDPIKPSENKKQTKIETLISFLSSYASDHYNLLILETLKLNLPYVFVNLAKQAKEDPNNDENQPLFTQVMILILRKAGENVDFNRLNYLQGELKKARSVNRGFEGEIIPLEKFLDLKKVENEYEKIFDLIAQNVFNCFFPEGVFFVKGMLAQTSIKAVGLINNNPEAWIKHFIKSYLIDSYQAITIDEKKQKEWATHLKTHVTEKEIEPIIKACFAFIPPLLKGLSQPNSAIELEVSKKIASFLPNFNQEDKSEEEKLENSNDELAHYLLKSLSVLLNSQDPVMSQMGEWTSQTLSHIFLAFLAHAEDFSLFLDLQASINSSNLFLKEFLQELPLPSFTHDLIVSILADPNLSFQINKFMQALPLMKFLNKDNLEISRQQLDKESGSELLSSLSQALSKDLFLALPNFINDYQEAAFVIIKNVFCEKFDEKHVALYAKALANFAATGEKITNKKLVKLFVEIAGGPSNTKPLEKKARSIKAKDLVKPTLFTPDQMIEKVQSYFPLMNDMMKNQLLEQINAVLHPVSSSLFSEIIKPFMQDSTEAVLLQFFTHLTKKYPPQLNKDSVAVMVEALLYKIEECYQKTAFPSHEELFHAIKEIFGLNSESLPEFFAMKVQGQTVKHLIESYLDQNLRAAANLFQTSFENFSPEVKSAQTNLKLIFGVESGQEAEATINHLVEAIVEKAPLTLLEQVNGQLPTLYAVNKSTHTFFHLLMQQHSAVAKVLLDYSQISQLKTVFQQRLENLPSLALPPQKQKTVELVTQLFLLPFNHFMEQTFNFLESEEGKEKAFFTRLLTEVTALSSAHLKIYNQTTRQAQQEGKALTQTSFARAAALAGSPLHRAVPSKASYEFSLNAIIQGLGITVDTEQEEKLRNQLDQLVANEKLLKQITLADIKKVIQETVFPLLSEEQMETLSTVTNPYLAFEEKGKKISLIELIYLEGRTPEMQRQNELYKATGKQLLELFFPNGQQDLSFLPPGIIKEQAWVTLQDQLMPSVLPLLTDLLLDPQTLTGAILSNLQAVNQSLSQADEELKTKDPLFISEENANEKGQKRELTELDDSLATLCEQMMEAMTIPSLVKSQLMNHEGHLKDTYKIMIGDLIQEQVQSFSLKDQLISTFKSGAQKPAEAATPSNSKKLSVEEIKSEIKKEARFTIDKSIHHMLHQHWKFFQAKVNRLISNVLGKVGTKLKKALDLIFNFMFFKVIKPILEILCFPIKKIIKNLIYHYVAVDENIELLTNFITQLPPDQTASANHAVFQEDLVFKIAASIKEALSNESEATS